MTYVRMCAAIGLLCSTAGLQAEDKPKSDLDAIQGSWEMVLRTPQGDVRVVKETKRETERVTYFAPSGDVLRAHTVEFKLSMVGKLRVFTYSNLTVVAGRGKGDHLPQEFSYAYKIIGDAFFEIAGVLDEDPAEPRIQRWTRIKAKQPAAPVSTAGR